MSQQIREETLELIKQKDKIEKEIDTLTDILHNNGVGMNEPLVDREDFPKTNIDIYQVRYARQRIICLQNDHKTLMNKIENNLQGYYSLSKNEANSMDTTPSPSTKTNHEVPFVKITFVSKGSPANIANLLVNDEIVEFGSINANNFKNINDVADVVRYSEGKSISLKIKRKNKFINLKLIPKKWQGKGLLGCNIEVI